MGCRAIALALLWMAAAPTAHAQQSAEMQVSVTVTPRCAVHVTDRNATPAESAVTLSCRGNAKTAQPVVTAETFAGPETPAVTKTPARSAEVLTTPLEQPDENARVSNDAALPSTAVVINF